MNDQRPTRWPCSADSSRNAGPAPRSFRNAETGVSQSSMKVSQTGTRLWRGLSDAGKQHLLGVGEAEPARAQQHGQVVEHVGGLLGHALVGLLARRARDLLGLLLHLLADWPRVGEQLGRVRALGPLGGAGGDRALEAGQRLVRRNRVRSPLWKQVRSPVWQAGPAGSTSASTASRSQSKRSAFTACVLPDVAPLCHSSSRERL